MTSTPCPLACGEPPQGGSPQASKTIPGTGAGHAAEGRTRLLSPRRMPATPFAVLTVTGGRAGMVMRENGRDTFSAPTTARRSAPSRKGPVGQVGLHLRSLLSVFQEPLAII